MNTFVASPLGAKLYMFPFFDNLGSVLAERESELKLKDILVLFDRDSGVSIFQDFRGYDDPIDDAEWILERNPKTRGFILRPVSQAEREGLWIGEYAHNGNTVIRHEALYDKGARQIGRLMGNYAQCKITERAFMGKMSLSSLKAKLRSEIVRSFRYYECPSDEYYRACGEVKKVYEVLKKKYRDRKVPYSMVADEILPVTRCSETVVCPLRAPNAFERLYNLNRALKSRGLGEVKFVSPGIVRIAWSFE